MSVTDYVLIAVDLALWAAIAWHRSQARVVGELWWSCVALGVIVTFKIGAIAHPFNRLTGGIYLDEVIGHLAGLLMITLTLGWLTRHHYGSPPPYRRARRIAAVAGVAFLLVTWFLAPIYDIPADASWIPAQVLASPVLQVHWIGLYAYLLAFCAIFVRLAGAEARRLPPGYVLTSVRLLLTAAVLLGTSVLIGIASRVALIVDDDAVLPAAQRAQNVLLMGVFALFVIAIAIPLARGRGGRGDDQSTEARVASLWTWIQSAGRGDAPENTADLTLTPSGVGGDLFDQVIDIRDGIWYLQRYLAPADVARAARDARGHGLVFGVRARAFTTAACLELAARRRGEQVEPVPPPPANLTRLGSGRTIDQEAYWLAAVSRALVTRLGAAPARP